MERKQLVLSLWVSLCSFAGRELWSDAGSEWSLGECMARSQKVCCLTPSLCLLQLYSALHLERQMLGCETAEAIYPFTNDVVESSTRSHGITCLVSICSVIPTNVNGFSLGSVQLSDDCRFLVAELGS